MLRADSVGRYTLSSQGKRYKEYHHHFETYQQVETIIRQLDRATLTYIRRHLEAALEPLAKELGVAIELGPCTFQASNCRFQLKVAVLDADGRAITEEAESFKHNAKLFGFESADLGKEFILQGQPYTISGFSTKNCKYPVIARAVNGKDYKFRCRTVLEALGREVPPWL